MEIKLIREDNQDFAAKFYSLSGFRLRITVPFERDYNNELLCFFSGIRGWITNTQPSPNEDHWMPLEEYFEELDIIVDSLNKSTTINPTSYKEALFLLIKKHISTYNRLIDNDLRSYVNRVLTVFLNLNIATETNSKAKCEKMMKNLENEVYSNFKEFIYLTNPNSNSMNPMARLSLTKYTDVLK
jgi:hypothetical protein